MRMPARPARWLPMSSPSAAATTPAALTAPAAPTAPAAGAGEGRRHPLLGPAAMLGSGLSNQVGAAVGSLAFPTIGALGVVTVRQYVAALVLLAVGRPRLRSFTAAQWRPVAGLAVVLGTMNLSLYSAIGRIGLGLAVTLEFLGPLAVALIGSRRRADLLCGLLAAAGAVIVMRPRPAADPVGIGLGVLAAAGWACYILLNRTLGRRVPGVLGRAAAALLSAVAFLPVGAVLAARHPLPAPSVACAVVAGILASAVPYLADLVALRRVPAQAFGLFMSVNPVLAALVGWAGLGQRLGGTEALGIAAVVAANALAAVSGSRARTGSR